MCGAVLLMGTKDSLRLWVFAATLVAFDFALWQVVTCVALHMFLSLRFAFGIASVSVYIEMSLWHFICLHCRPRQWTIENQISGAWIFGVAGSPPSILPNKAKSHFNTEVTTIVYLQMWKLTASAIRGTQISLSNESVIFEVTWQSWMIATAFQRVWFPGERQVNMSFLFLITHGHSWDIEKIASYRLANYCKAILIWWLISARPSPQWVRHRACC